MGAPGGLRNIGSPDRELQEPAPRVRPGAEGPGPRAGPGAGGHRVRGEEARTPHALQKSLRSQSPSVQLHTRCLAHTRGPSIHPPPHRPRRLPSAWGPAAAAPRPPARCAWPRGCSPPHTSTPVLDSPAGQAGPRWLCDRPLHPPTARWQLPDASAPAGPLAGPLLTLLRPSPAATAPGQGDSWPCLHSALTPSASRDCRLPEGWQHQPPRLRLCPRGTPSSAHHCPSDTGRADASEARVGDGGARAGAPGGRGLACPSASRILPSMRTLDYENRNNYGVNGL